MADTNPYERPGIAGSGAIATGLAACASVLGEVILVARSQASATKAEEAVAKATEQVDDADASRISVTTDPSAVADCDVVIEAIREDLALKAEFLSDLGQRAPAADLATTTSSLSIGALGEQSNLEERLFGLHPFNPVTKMDLVELCIPDSAGAEVGARARAWCDALGKRAIEVPDQTGFVVNRLLFPYLFDAVRLLERTGMDPKQIDECMSLGAGHPMGPLALLDFVGLDVAEAIGDALHADSGDSAHRPPGRIVELVGEGRLGRKAGAGFFDYD